MKIYKSQGGPFSERPYYTHQEIQSICISELQKVNLYPNEVSPIRIERFIEKRFGIHTVYKTLPGGVLAYTKFGPRGVEEMVVSRDLVAVESKSSARRLLSTWAHEVGHALLHAHLFVLENEQLKSLFGEGIAQNEPKILCRDDSVLGGKSYKNLGYSGQWWEYQANQAIGALLLPRPLVLKALEGLMVENGSFGEQILEQSHNEEAKYLLSEVFDVNPIVAEFRIKELFDLGKKQLTL